MPQTYVREEGTAGRLGARLMAIVAEAIEDASICRQQLNRKQSLHPPDLTICPAGGRDCRDNPRWFSPSGLWDQAIR